MNKSSQQKCFFAAQGLCPANRTEPGLQLFCSASPALWPTSSAKTCYALLPHRQPSFCPVSPEAGLLTEEKG